MTLPRQASEQAMTDSHHAVSEALSVFGQSTIASLAITKNVFDVPKGVLHLGTDTGFDFFDFLSPGISLLAGASRLAIYQETSLRCLCSSLF